MKHSLLIPALLVALGLAACDKPTVITVPATPVAVPGPAGPPGAAGVQGAAGSQGAMGNQGYQGNQGNDGSKGATGSAGEGTTVIVIPPAASSPSN